MLVSSSETLKEGYGVLSRASALRISAKNMPEDKVFKKLMLPRGIYVHLCPNCGGSIEDNRLIFRNACSKCMGNNDIVFVEDIVDLAKYLKQLNDEGVLKKIIDVKNFVKEFKKFFVKCIGNDPWNLQVSWVIRIAQNQSFALIAPTGVGKTTFGLITALFLAYRYGRKAYIIVPTAVLVKLYEKKLNEFMERAGVVVNVVAIHSRIPQKRRIELENEIRKGSFDILITTSRYLIKNFEDVFNVFLSNGGKIDFIFVDDVDAVMKGSKAIDLILMLAGFSSKDIEEGYKAALLRQRLLRCEAAESERERKNLCYENGKDIRDVFEEIQRRLAMKRKSCGIVIISSATGRARGRRVKLFRELLGFYIGSAVEIYRNIVDTCIPMPKDEDKVADLLSDLIKKLGDGGLIYVPVDKGLEYAYKLRDSLSQRGLSIEVLSSRQPHVIEKFASGEYKALIGVATYYGLLVRGIDIPERIRYAIFVGVPRHKISLSQISFSPLNLLRLLTVLSEVVSDTHQRENIIKIIANLRRIIRRTSAEKLRIIVEKMSKGEVVEDPVAVVIAEARNLVSTLLSSKNVVEALKNYPKASIVEEGGSLYILIPDAPTYIQASGRTSRLFAGGVTTGLSIVLIDDERLIKGLTERARFFIEDFMFKPFEEVNLSDILRRIDVDRELVKQLRAGVIPINRMATEFKVKTVLFIVESPNKARTIASFFGRPTYREFDGLKVYETNVGEMHIVIASTGGHIFEVVEEELQEDSVYGIAVTRFGDKVLFLPKYDYIKRCLNCGTQFVKGDQCPSCGSTRYRSSKSIIEALQKLALEVEEVVIATDPDSEGEKIGYDIAVALAPFAKTIVRAEFHEVTRRAILNALRNLRGLDILLVEAQITRRIEDRWLGFALSEYVTSQLKALGLISQAWGGRLSAGRVQTPTLGRVIEIYLSRMKTLRKSKLIYLEGGLVIEVPQSVLEEVLKEEVRRLSPSRVDVVFKPLSKRIEVLSPLPPFTTDEMIAEAHRALGIDAVDVMKLAQDLFELGFITYHRTDSTRISSVGINIAKEYLGSVFGNKFEELFEPRTWGTGGAHEGIRPTKPLDVEKLRELLAEGVIEVPTRLSSNHFKLYDLIFRRFIASQMKPATVEKSEFLVIVNVDGKEVLRNIVEVVTGVLDPGFMLVYAPIKVVPLLFTEFTLKPSKIVTVLLSDYQLPTQGDIIRWMRETNIGRPSTYAKIIDTIVKRRYVVSGKGGVLIPTTEGFYVYTVLSSTNFSESVYELDEYLALLKNIFKKKEQVLDNIVKLLSIAHNGIKRMVSVRRTRELYEKIQAVEENKMEYMDIVYELFKEVCLNVLKEFGKGVEMCRKLQGQL
ncbi:MAG: reverse gyrase [Desulfurococcaceae archaeon]|nr:reverse gyrase [Desulfurococcaceae archaeon]